MFKHRGHTASIPVSVHDIPGLNTPVQNTIISEEPYPGLEAVWEIIYKDEE